MMAPMNADLKLPAGVSISPGRGGLDRILIDTDLAQAEIYLHGAHVAHFHPRQQAKPVLWLSGSSLFERDKPIRGGVPICFPWFGPKADDPKAPAHGVARLLPWTLERVRKNEDGSIVVALQLQSSDETRRRGAPGDFIVQHEISIGSNLELQLHVRNRGTSSFQFQEALHSYFTVGDVRQIAVRGLEGATYLDRLQDGKRLTQDRQPIRFGGETDRSYINTTAACTIEDAQLSRSITIEKSGSNTTVVWNPWTAKAKAMPDFGDDEWTGMVCIETANAHENTVKIPAGGEHVMTAHISARR
jgi:glucose-6-phosphate 1-epimerase